MAGNRTSARGVGGNVGIRFKVGLWLCDHLFEGTREVADVNGARGRAQADIWHRVTRPYSLLLGL